MGHQHRNGHVLEEITTNAAHQGFSQLRMVITARNDHVGREIGGAREQNVRYRKTTPQGFIRCCIDRVPLQMTDDPLECRPMLLEIPLICADEHYRDGLGVCQQRQSVVERSVRFAGPVPSDKDAFTDCLEDTGIGDDPASSPLISTAAGTFRRLRHYYWF
jgi:hypothetical protein